MMRGRVLGIVLALSVALNLFFAGIGLARVWHQRELGGRGDRGPAAGWHRPPHGPRRQPLAWLSESDRAALRPQRKALQSLRHDAAEQLRADDFDAAKFASTLQALRAETARLQATAHELLVQHAASISPAERRRLADAWGGPPERGR